MKDILGKALLDFYNGNYSEDIITATNISENDVLPLPYLFRNFKNMPKLEKQALKLAKGSILDVGCGAGSHSLYLQHQGLHVKAIDISKGAVAVAKKRGVINAEITALLNETDTFDTILLLMNGTGIFKTLKLTQTYLNHLKKILNVNGQILIDSSDIAYMYEDSDGGFWHDVYTNYYGELEYYMSYKGEKEQPITWLYLDFKTLKMVCEAVGLKCKLILEGKHFDYLARLSHT